MPGSSLWSGFLTVARTWMLRVEVSTSELIALIEPAKLSFG
jgi:hypothetical protein